jgi:hypothetical protein
MTEIENLVLEQLRAIRGDITEIKGDLHFLSQRVGVLEQHMATLITVISGGNSLPCPCFLRTGEGGGGGSWRRRL